MRRVALVMVVVLAGCATGTPSTTPPTTTPPVTPTNPPADSTTSTILPHETTEALLGPFSEMGPGWSETFFRYGESEEYLGLAPGGEGLLLGPEYGAQTGDGRWWFLDSANLRIARFDEQGEYLDDYELPEALLVGGEFFQYQMPRALDNNSIVAFGFREVGTSILTVTDDQAYGSLIPVHVGWTATDGTFLYGADPDGQMYRLATWDGSVTATQWFHARNRSRYRVSVDGDELHVELPDIGVTRTVQMRLEEQPEVVVHFGVQVDTGVDGTLFILIYGAPLTDPELGVGGLLTIGPDGTVGRMQPVVDLFSPADPGSPSHLGVRPGTSTPWVMVIGEDGVHVYTRHN